MQETDGELCYSKFCKDISKNEKTLVLGFNCSKCQKGVSIAPFCEAYLATEVDYDKPLNGRFFCSSQVSSPQVFSDFYRFLPNLDEFSATFFTRAVDVSWKETACSVGLYYPFHPTEVLAVQRPFQGGVRITRFGADGSCLRKIPVDSIRAEKTELLLPASDFDNFVQLVGERAAILSTLPPLQGEEDSELLPLLRSELHNGKYSLTGPYNSTTTDEAEKSTHFEERFRRCHNYKMLTRTLEQVSGCSSSIENAETDSESGLQRLSARLRPCARSVPRAHEVDDVELMDVGNEQQFAVLLELYERTIVCCLSVPSEEFIDCLCAVGEPSYAGYPLCSECAAEAVSRLWVRARAIESEAERLECIIKEKNNSGHVTFSLGNGNNTPLPEACHESARVNDLQSELAADENELNRLCAELEEAVAISEQVEAAAESVLEEVHSRKLVEQRLADLLEVQKSPTGPTAELQRLNEQSVLTLLYEIDISSSVGSLNGFCLGRLAYPVDDWEINTACGFALQLVAHLLRRHPQIKLSRRTFFFCAGPSSRFWQLNTYGNEVEFHFFISRGLIFSSNFGPAWVAFISVVKDIVEYFGSQCDNINDAPSAPAFTIEGDQVGGSSVNYGHTTQETWTKGAHNILALLNWCIKVDAILKFKSVH